LEFAQAQEFAVQTTASDLGRIRQIGISISDDADTEPGLEVGLVFSPRATLQDAVSLRVAGSNRTVVEGIRAQLKERLESGCRFPWVPGPAVAAAIAAFLGIAALFLSAVGLVYDATPESLKHTSWGAWAAVGTLGLIVAVASVPWAILFPRFEWLGDDRRTRWDRWRRTTLIGLGAIATAVIASVVASTLV
jgi:hypothetical protein